MCFDEWKVTNARGYPDLVTFDSGQKARAFQANHGGTVWHRKASPWRACDIELVNATQTEVDAGDGGLRLVGPDDPRHSHHTR